MLDDISSVQKSCPSRALGVRPLVVLVGQASLGFAVQMVLSSSYLRELRGGGDGLRALRRAGGDLVCRREALSLLLQHAGHQALL